MNSPSFIVLLLALVSPTLAGLYVHKHLVMCLTDVFNLWIAYGDLRIDDGGSSGRLEFQRWDGTWGTVCDNGFNDDAADVACNQLGYRRASSYDNT